MSSARQGDRSRLAAVVLAVALAVVLVGSVAPGSDTSVPEGLGEVDGIEHDESLSITVGDGLDEEELDVLVARAMARIEVIRGLNFEEDVDVEVLTREEYRERRDRERSEAERAWENLRWEAMFVIGQDRDATAVLDEVFAGGVGGFYSHSDERIVIVSDADQPTVNKETLVHELVHALQDQRFGLDSDATTTDAWRARDSVVEGEAEVVPDLYLDRCGVVWSCVRPETEDNTTDVALGIRVEVLMPYIQGEEFVDATLERGGWEAVDELHERYPESTTEVIHPGRYPADTPTVVSITDRSSDAWNLLGAPDDVRTTDTLGEAGIYTMLVHSDAIDVDDPHAYDHPFSTGWAGDQFVPYERDGEVGYVWEIAWESRDDAEEFAHAYREVIENNGGVETGEDVFVVPDGPFEGAFRLTQEGRTVRIVNAPTTDALDGIYGGPG